MDGRDSAETWSQARLHLHMKSGTCQISDSNELFAITDTKKKKESGREGSEYSLSSRLQK